MLFSIEFLHFIYYYVSNNSDFYHVVRIHRACFCLERIIYNLIVNNFIMKIPNGKEYGANSDERETFAPKELDLENKFEEIKRK